MKQLSSIFLSFLLLTCSYAVAMEFDNAPSVEDGITDGKCIPKGLNTDARDVQETKAPEAVYAFSRKSNAGSIAHKHMSGSLDSLNPRVKRYPKSSLQEQQQLLDEYRLLAYRCHLLSERLEQAATGK